MDNKWNELIIKSFNKPEEQEDYPGLKIDHLTVGEIKISRYTIDGGWHWPEDLESCQEDHLIWLVISGCLGLKMDDGSIEQFDPGDIARIPPGHIVWVIGEEPVVAINIESVRAGEDQPS